MKQSVEVILSSCAIESPKSKYAFRYFVRLSTVIYHSSNSTLDFQCVLRANNSICPEQKTAQTTEAKKLIVLVSDWATPFDLN